LAVEDTKLRKRHFFVKICPDHCCSNDDSEEKIAVAAPSDFGFIVVYGYGRRPRTVLNTFEKIFIQDLAQAETQTTEMTLSEEELNAIYTEMRKINIWSYPVHFQPPEFDFPTTPRQVWRALKGSERISFHYRSYIFEIRAHGKKKTIRWADRNLSETKKANQLHALVEYIDRLVKVNSAYDNLPPYHPPFLL